jgi:hypothetical protein
MKIQKELDETKIVLHKTIESVLERGEKIDNLVAKSDGLSAQSKMFYTQVRLSFLSGLNKWRSLTFHRPRSRTRAASSCEYALVRFPIPVGRLCLGQIVATSQMTCIPFCQRVRS